MRGLCWIGSKVPFEQMRKYPIFGERVRGDGNCVIDWSLDFVRPIWKSWGVI